jgi:V8-like Glu-specific endopeptidase
MWVTPEAEERSRRDEMNVGISKSLEAFTPRALGQRAIRVPPTAVSGSIRVRLRLAEAGVGDWVVRIADASGTIDEQVTKAMFTGDEYWSGEIPGGQAHVGFIGPPRGARVEATAYAAQVTVGQPQGIIGDDNSRPISDPAVPSRVKPWARSVARLKFIGSRGEDACSGFLVGGRLLFTNYHCISTAAHAASALVEFGVDSAAAKPTTFRVTTIESLDRPLDYSLLRLSADASAFGRLHVGGSVTTGMRLFIVQHPLGLPKKVAFPPVCRVGHLSLLGVGSAPNDFGHLCDTLSSSSGSPVMDAMSGVVVGLHHWNYLPGAIEQENQAIHMRLVLDHLRAMVTARTLEQSTLDEVRRPGP